MPFLHIIAVNWWRIALVWLAMDMLFIAFMWRLTDRYEEMAAMREDEVRDVLRGDNF